MTKEQQQTPAPIPEDFKQWASEKAKVFADSMMFEPLEKLVHQADLTLHSSMVKAAKYLAMETFRHLASQQTMRWVKCTERLPPDVNKRYAARVKSMFGSDPILCVIKRSGSDSWLAGPIAGDYPSVTTESIIEWLDESPAPIQ